MKNQAALKWLIPLTGILALFAAGRIRQTGCLRPDCRADRGKRASEVQMKR
jgi:hypothetical protein